MHAANERRLSFYLEGEMREGCGRVECARVKLNDINLEAS